MFYPDAYWPGPCSSCARLVFCNSEGVCKRCLTNAWPAPMDVLPRLDALAFVAMEPAASSTPIARREPGPAYEPRCVQCGARQAEAPGPKCKHHAWHDLPAPEVIETMLVPPDLEEKAS